MNRTGFDTMAMRAGLVGTTVMTLASVVTGLVYRGTDGQTYSPFNHWVSELGEVGVSALALVFNAGLIVGGLMFAIFMAGLARTRRGPLAVAYGLIGVIAGLAGTGVGLFPMNDLARHALVAFTFFNLGWIAVGLASIDLAIRPDPRFPRWLSTIGAATVVAFIAFLVTLRTEGLMDDDGLASPDVRRAFWIVPTLEWALILGVIAWVFLTAWCWRRATR